MTIEQQVQRWVKQAESLLQPSSVHWCGGSAEESNALCSKLVTAGTFLHLNQQLRPNSYLCRTDPGEAQLDHNENVFVCSRTKAEASQLRQWADAEATKIEVNKLLGGSMRGRTMYVLPLTLGPYHSIIGLELCLKFPRCNQKFIIPLLLYRRTVGFL